MTALDSFDFEHNGRSYTAEIHADEDHGAPWEEEDGHGPVSDWTTRAKAPGEMVLKQDRNSRRYYDFAAAVKIARRDGWGLSPEERQRLAADLGREPTRGQIVRAAVLADYENLRRWCNDEWHYVGVVVRPADACRCCGPSASLGGIESDAGDYLQEVAREMAEQLETEAAAGRQPMHPDDALRLARTAIPPLEV